MATATELREFLWSSAPLAQKHKTLNLFLKTLTASDVDDVLAVFDINDPRSHWIHLKLADKFHRIDTIVNLLKHGNRKVVSNAVKLPWLYGRVDEDGDEIEVAVEAGEVDAHEKMKDDECEPSFENCVYLVHKLFPLLSYSCRLKIVNNIGKFMRMEHIADSIHHCVQHLYGFHTAVPLLPACSRYRISCIMSARVVNFTNRQLLAIAKKHPDIAYAILKKYHSDSLAQMRVYPVVIRELIDQNPVEFTRFYVENYQPLYFRLGWKRTRKILRLAKEIVLQHPDKFIEILNVGEVRKRLSLEQFEVMVRLSMPKELVDWQSDPDMWIWLDKYPKEMRLEILKNSFFRTYKIQLLDCPEYFSPDVVAILPPDERLEIVEWKIKGDSQFTEYGQFNGFYGTSRENLFAWTAFKPLDKSVTELQDLLFLEQEIPNRAQISKCLVMTCLVNESPQALLRVLTLLVQQSRNDTIEVRNEIFVAIAAVVDHLEFGQDHWNCVMEMIRLSHLYKEHSDETKIKLLEKYIVFLFKQNLPMDPIARLLVMVKLEANYEDEGEWKWTISDLKRPTEQALVLQMFVRVLENAFPLGTSLPGGDKYCIQSGVANLVNTISKWNKLHGKTHAPIPLLGSPWLAAQLHDIMGLENTASHVHISRSQVLSNRLHQIKTFSARAILKDPLYHQLQEEQEKALVCGFPCEPFLTHHLLKNPSLLEENWDQIIATILKFKEKAANSSSLFFMRKIKLLGYAVLMEKTMKACSQKIFEGKGISSLEKSNAIRILAILQKPDDFIQNIASTFYPTEKDIDITKENSEIDYEIKTAVAKSLRDVESSLTLDAIKKFCVGDYFKLVAGSMYSQYCHLPEPFAFPFLRTELETNKSVSVKKHLVRLLIIAPLQQRKDMVTATWSRECHLISLRHEIFVQLVRVFLDDSMPNTWQTLHKGICVLLAEDKTSLSYLQNPKIFSIFPHDYLSVYVQASANMLHLHKLKEGVGEIGESLSGFITQVKCVMNRVNPVVLDQIAKEFLCYFDNEEDFICRPTESSFFNQYLLLSPDPEILAHRIAIIKETLVKFMNDEAFQQTLDSIHRSRKAIYSFVRFLCEEGLESPLLSSDETTNITTTTPRKENDLEEKIAEEARFEHFKARQIFQEILDQLSTFSASKTFRAVLYLRLAIGLLNAKEKKPIIIEENNKKGTKDNVNVENKNDVQEKMNVDKEVKTEQMEIKKDEKEVKTEQTGNQTEETEKKTEVEGEKKTDKKENDEKMKKLNGGPLMRRFGVAASRLIDATVGQYGGEIIGLVIKTLKQFIDDCLTDNLDCQDDVVEFIYGLLNGSTSKCNQIVAVILLPRSAPKTAALKTIYLEIQKTLAEAGDIVALIFQGA